MKIIVDEMDDEIVSLEEAALVEEELLNANNMEPDINKTSSNLNPNNSDTNMNSASLENNCSSTDVEANPGYEHNDQDFSENKKSEMTSCVSATDDKHFFKENVETNLDTFESERSNSDNCIEGEEEIILMSVSDCDSKTSNVNELKIENQSDKLEKDGNDFKLETDGNDFNLSTHNVDKIYKQQESDSNRTDTLSVSIDHKELDKNRSGDQGPLSEIRIKQKKLFMGFEHEEIYSSNYTQSNGGLLSIDDSDMNPKVVIKKFDFSAELENSRSETVDRNEANVEENLLKNLKVNLNNVLNFDEHVLISNNSAIENETGSHAEFGDNALSDGAENLEDDKPHSVAIFDDNTSINNTNTDQENSFMSDSVANFDDNTSGSNTNTDQENSIIAGSSSDGASENMSSHFDENMMYYDETDEDDMERDMFCWQCHKEGPNMLKCVICPRVFHGRCHHLITGNQLDKKPTKYCCPECKIILESDNNTKKSSGIDLDKLCAALNHLVNRLKLSENSELFYHPVDTKEFPRYRDYIVHPMDISILERNVKNQIYRCPEAFLADVKWIVHNSIVFNSNVSKITTIARCLLKMCKREIAEIETCLECYYNSLINDDWFTEVCKRPHILIWAKLKGFPAWPAKAMKSKHDQVDVRFFGEHNRAWVPIKNCYLYSEIYPQLTRSRKPPNLKGCEEEVKRHIKKLESLFGKFKYFPGRIFYDPAREAEYLQRMLPEYNFKLESMDSTNDAVSQNFDKTKDVRINAFADEATKNSNVEQNLDEVDDKMDYESNSDSTDRNSPARTDDSKSDYDSTELPVNDDLVKSESDSECLNSDKDKLSIGQNNDEKNMVNKNSDMEDDNNSNKEDDESVVPNDADNNMTLGDKHADLVISEESDNTDIAVSDVPNLVEVSQDESGTISIKNSVNVTEDDPEISDKNSESTVQSKNLKESQNLDLDAIYLNPIKIEPMSIDNSDEESALVIDEDFNAICRNGNQKNDKNVNIDSQTLSEDFRSTSKVHSGSSSPALDASLRSDLEVVYEGKKRKGVHDSNESISSIKKIDERHSVNITENVTLSLITETQIGNNNWESRRKRIKLLPDNNSTNNATSNDNNRNVVKDPVVTNEANPEQKTIEEKSDSSSNNSSTKLNAEITGSVIKNIYTSCFAKLGLEVEKVINEMLEHLANAGDYRAKVILLQKELEQNRRHYTCLIEELKHDYETQILEMRATNLAKIQYEIAMERLKFEREKEEVIKDAKSKQWCANCQKVANYYCCWNTAYCGFVCQQTHWKQHMPICVNEMVKQKVNVDENAPPNGNLLDNQFFASTAVPQTGALVNGIVNPIKPSPNALTYICHSSQQFNNNNNNNQNSVQNNGRTPTTTYIIQGKPVSIGPHRIILPKSRVPSGYSTANNVQTVVACANGGSNINVTVGANNVVSSSGYDKIKYIPTYAPKQLLNMKNLPILGQRPANTST